MNDPGLEELRDMTLRFMGVTPPPNHHGVIAEDFGDSWLIYFDDGVGAPYPKSDVELLEAS